MKNLALVFLIFLTGCFSDTDDIRMYMDDVKANTKSYIKPMAEVPEFNHVVYVADSKNSPFVLPKPEVIQERIQKTVGCLSPEINRNKQALEKYPLDTLIMRGTLGDLGISWALIEALDKTIYKVKVGNYLGIYNGKITVVNSESVSVLELVPDGSGCWIERESIVTMIDASAKRQKN